MSDDTPDLDVAVIGAGAAGLATAYALTRAGRSVRVFEAADRVGGRMSTLRRDGYLIDTGAEMLATHGYPATWRLLRACGLRAAEVPRITASVAVWRDGRARPDVGRPRGVLTGAGLSARARIDLLRFQAEVFAHRADLDPDRPERAALGGATVADLAARYHRDLGEYLFGPITGGFFGWSGDRSAAAPFVAHLAATGSSTTWRTYRDGMDTLAGRLAARLPVTTRAAAHEVTLTPGGVCVRLDGGTLSARSAVLAVPAPVAARLYPGAPDDERAFLDACGFTPMLRVSCELDRPLQPSARHPVYLLLVPQSADPVLAVLTVDHNKAHGRAPRGRGLITLLAGPGAAGELIGAPDGRVIAELAERAERYVPGLRAATVRSTVHRFGCGLPEATPHAVALRAGFQARPVRAVDYAGDWLMLRPSSEGAFRSAEITAPRVLDHLLSETPTRRPETAQAGRPS